MRNMKITTSKIAQICGVSQGTVDRALNNRSDIKAETKQRIVEVAKQYGYREEVECGAENETVGEIGIIIFNLNNEYFTRLVTELEYHLRKEKLGTVIMMSHYNGRYEIECMKNLYNMGVKGIILCSVNSGEEFENYLKLFDIPIVAVGNRLSSVPYVGIDDFEAMRELTASIIREEWDNIIYFSPAINYQHAYAQTERYKGFLNMIGNRKYSVVTNIKDIEKHYNEKTAIICSNDYYALKLYFMGCDAKIVGFDNISMIEEYNTEIDSVGYSVAEIAEKTIETIKNNKKNDTLIKHYLAYHSN